MLRRQNLSRAVVGIARWLAYRTSISRNLPSLAATETVLGTERGEGQQEGTWETVQPAVPHAVLWKLPFPLSSSSAAEEIELRLKTIKPLKVKMSVY